LADAIGQPELAVDAKFDSFASRRDNREELTDILEAVFRSDTTDAWIDKLTTAGVPCGPVNTVLGALSDPHTLARNMLVETDHPRFGAITQVATAARVGSIPPARGRAPARNEDGPEILRDLLEYPDTLVSELRNTGAFGALPGEISEEKIGDVNV
jgi:crotonobetainyl-CoA:carnitine CoA-transferase CaiB-like acyl-CoA transferase